MSQLSLSRRRFLRALGAGATALPAISLPGFAGAAPGDGNILILIELSGGNDGLNTVVPISDPAYRGLRPNIGIGAQDALSLDADTALHPAMRGMADLWDKGQVQIIEGVGYPDPNRSHFRSIEIWNAGLGAEGRARAGWISSAFAEGAAPTGHDADGLVLGGEMGPLVGQGRFGAMRSEDTFLETIETLPGGGHRVRPDAGRTPLEHVLATYENARATGDVIRRKLERTTATQWDFPQTALGEQLRTAARLLEAGVSVPVLKVVQDGYDTHDNQPGAHEELLRDLSQATHAFARAMQKIGLWEQTTVLTYSEFGRTARENGSWGTDHGTAAPVFALGGHVRGGLSGRRVALDRLVDGDLQFTTDYRAVYASVLNDLWGIKHPADRAGLRLLR